MARGYVGGALCSVVGGALCSVVGCSSGVDIGAPVAEHGAAESDASTAEGAAADDDAVDALDTDDVGATVVVHVPQQEDPRLGDQRGETDEPNASDPLDAENETDAEPADDRTDPMPPGEPSTATDGADAGESDQQPTSPGNDGPEDAEPQPECDKCVEDTEIYADIADIVDAPEGCDEYPRAAPARFAITPELLASSDTLYVHLQEVIGIPDPNAHELQILDGQTAPDWLTLTLEIRGDVRVTLDASARAPAVGGTAFLLTRLSDNCPIAEGSVEVHLVQ